MAGLNGHHQAKVMKDAFSSTEAKGFFHRGREKKIKGSALLGVGLGGKGQGSKVALVPWSHGIKRKRQYSYQILCAPAYPCRWRGNSSCGNLAQEGPGKVALQSAGT